MDSYTATFTVNAADQPLALMRLSQMCGVNAVPANGTDIRVTVVSPWTADRLDEAEARIAALNPVRS